MEYLLYILFILILCVGILIGHGVITTPVSAIVIFLATYLFTKILNEYKHNNK